MRASLCYDVRMIVPRSYTVQYAAIYDGRTVGFYGSHPERPADDGGSRSRAAARSSCPRQMKTEQLVDSNWRAQASCSGCAKTRDSKRFQNTKKLSKNVNKIVDQKRLVGSEKTNKNNNILLSSFWRKKCWLNWEDTVAIINLYYFMLVNLLMSCYFIKTVLLLLIYDS